MVANPLRVLGIMVITMTVNALVLFALSRLFRLEPLSSMEAALMLAASGEFAFVVLQIGMHDNLLGRSVGNTILVASILSMYCIPLLSSLATAIRRYALRTAPAQ